MFGDYRCVHVFARKKSLNFQFVPASCLQDCVAIWQTGHTLSRGTRRLLGFCKVNADWSPTATIIPVFSVSLEKVQALRSVCLRASHRFSICRTRFLAAVIDAKAAVLALPGLVSRDRVVARPDRTGQVVAARHDLPLKTIARQTGFLDQQCFSDVFFRRRGVHPSCTASSVPRTATPVASERGPSEGHLST